MRVASEGSIVSSRVDQIRGVELLYLELFVLCFSARVKFAISRPLDVGMSRAATYLGFEFT